MLLYFRSPRPWWPRRVFPTCATAFSSFRTACKSLRAFSASWWMPSTVHLVGVVGTNVGYAPAGFPFFNTPSFVPSAGTLMLAMALSRLFFLVLILLLVPSPGFYI